MLEVATAARQDGLRKDDSERIDESFRLASEALGIGIAYSSERVIEKARRFRRGYAGPGTSHVRSLDEKLRDMACPKWIKSSYSGGTGGNCVEVAVLPDGSRAIRDSKDRNGPFLYLTPAQWANLGSLCISHGPESS